jgi:hypothetical protein
MHLFDLWVKEKEAWKQSGGIKMEDDKNQPCAKQKIRN